MRKFLALVFVLFSGIATFGQVAVSCSQAAYAIDATSGGSNLLRRIPGATITVCAAGSSGVPCSPLSTVYNTSGFQIPNPFFAGADGKYQVCTASAGSFMVQVSATGLPTTINDQVAIGSISGSANNIFTGINTFSGNVLLNGTANLVCSLDGALVVNPGCFAPVGSDIGIAINAAYATLPSTGGRIYIPAISGSYNYSTPIVFNTSGKCPLLEGRGINEPQTGGSVSLNYIPTTATTAITFDCTPTGGGAQSPGAGARDLLLINNNCLMVGGCGSSATGIATGATNKGCAQCLFSNVRVSGFSSGWSINDTGNIGWGITWINSVCDYNGTGVLWTGTGGHENDKWIGGVCQLNATGFNLVANSELTIEGSSIDGNTTCGVTMNGNAFLHVSDVHWENPNTSNVQYVCGAAASVVNIKGGQVLDDNNSGSTANPLFTFGFGKIVGTSLFSAGQSESVRVVNCLTRCSIDFVNLSPTIFQTADNMCFGGACQVGEAANFSSTPGFINAGVFGCFEQSAPPSATFNVGNYDYWYCDSLAHRPKIFNNGGGATTLAFFSDNLGVFATGGTIQPATVVAAGSICTNGELSLSAGWQVTGTATVTSVAGQGQTCTWTITTGTTTAASPTVTDTLTNPLPSASVVCEMSIHGGTHTAAAGESFFQSGFSATAPVFTFNGTPTANGFTYVVTRRCGP